MNRKTLKIIICFVFIAILLMSTVAASGIKKNIEVLMNSINLTVNGQKVAADTIVYNGVTYVPLRATAEMLGKEVGWDQKTNTASINDKTSVKTSTNYNRTNPAPIGVTQNVTVNDILNNYSAEVTVTEIIRGEKAWNLIKEANMFNAEPAVDEEYILAKIKIKILTVKDDKKVDVSSVNFDVYSENNVEYSNMVSVVEPEPQLDTSLYKDGEHEGYAAFKVKMADVKPKVGYGQKYDGTGGIWFKLY